MIRSTSFEMLNDRSSLGVVFMICGNTSCIQKNRMIIVFLQRSDASWLHETVSQCRKQTSVDKAKKKNIYFLLCIYYASNFLMLCYMQFPQKLSFIDADLRILLKETEKSFTHQFIIYLLFWFGPLCYKRNMKCLVECAR